MFLKSLSQFLRKLAVNIACQAACFTMIFSTVAMGREAEAISKNNLQNYLREFGLDQKTTLGEFWERSKAYFPPDMAEDFEAYVKANKNLKMPEVVLSKALTSGGEEIPVLNINNEGKQTTIQFFGEKNKWVKFNNVVLSEKEINNLTETMKKIEANDPNSKKDADKFREKVRLKSKYKITRAQNHKKIVARATDFARFEGFPRITPDMWRGMTREQRVGYIVRMRLMWVTAQKVLDINNAATDKPSARLQRQFEKSNLEMFYQNIFGKEAWAESGRQPAAAKTPIKLNESCSPSASLSGKACITAGLVAGDNKEAKNKYRMIYNSSSGNSQICACSYDDIIADRPAEQVQELLKLKDECAVDNAELTSQIPNADKGSWVACNPKLYSYQASGKFAGRPFCVHTMSEGFQRATAFSSGGKLTASCDEQSRLSINEFAVRDANGYKNLDEIRKQIETEQRNLTDPNQDFLYTRNFIDGALKRKGNDNSLKEILEGKWDEKIDKQLVDIQMAFEIEINQAIKLCSANIGKGQEPNHTSACDQLHRRWLFTEKFIAQFRQKACDPNSTYIGSYEKDESSLSEKAQRKTSMNKSYVETIDKNLCECKAPAGVKIKFEEKCSSLGQDKKDPTEPCPDGTYREAQYGVCICTTNADKAFKIEEANKIAAAGPIADFCGKPEVKEKRCGVDQNISNYDYQICKCVKGELQEDGPGFFNGIANFFKAEKNEKQSTQVCKESTLKWWLLGAAGIFAILFFRHKKTTGQPIAVTPAPTPTPTSTPSTEGGGGVNKCYKPGTQEEIPCNGGVPTAPPAAAPTTSSSGVPSATKSGSSRK